MAYLQLAEILCCTCLPVLEHIHAFVSAELSQMLVLLPAGASRRLILSGSSGAKRLDCIKLWLCCQSLLVMQKLQALYDLATQQLLQRIGRRKGRLSLHPLFSLLQR